jgi:hypothetical protein
MTDWYGSFQGIPRTLRNLKLTYRGKSSASCTQNVWLWNFTTNAWQQIDARTIGTTEVQFDRVPPAAPATYVNASGVLHARVRCTKSTSFYTSANLLRITYDK